MLKFSPLFSLEDKIALVTGANKGLGQAMAVGLATAGANIIGVSSGPHGEHTAALVEKQGRRYCHIAADLRSMESVSKIMEEGLATYGRIDILVNNAGIIRRNDSLDFTEADWDDVMNVNLKVLFFLSQAMARNCVENNRPGKIINIASMLSFQGGIRVPSYTASKSGVKGLTMLLANEWASKGINVNAIAPGYMATDTTEALQKDTERNKAILDRIPAGRWGEPEDLVGAVIFLASRASDYVQGHTLAVDGGWLGR